MATCTVCDQPIEEHAARDLTGHLRTWWEHTIDQYPRHEPIPEHLTEPPF